MAPKIELHHGDCRDVLRTLPSDSLDSCVTDPPYALVSVVKRFGGANAAPAKGNDAYMRASAGFMGKTWDTGETAFSTGFWSEVYRVLKPGAFVAAFGASRGYHRMACAIEDAGFEIRDSLMWVYGTGFPKSQNVAKFIDKELGVDGAKGAVTGKSGAERSCMAGDFTGGEYHEYLPGSPQAQEFDGFGTALKPAFEPIVLARKPLSEGTVAANVLRWRTGALNIDASRVPAEKQTGLGGGAAGGNTWNETNNGLGKDGEARPVDGRWPANVVHDGSDEVVGAFPSAGGQQGRAKIGGEKKGSIYGDFGANQTTNPEPRGDSGSAARFFYSAKASRLDRAGSKHPTVKPIALMEWLTTLITPPSGTVLDPFAGSGTTGTACRNKGFNCILIEREAEYVADIRRRLGLAEGTDPLDAAIQRYLRQKRVLAGLAA